MRFIPGKMTGMMGYELGVLIRYYSLGKLERLVGIRFLHGLVGDMVLIGGLKVKGFVFEVRLFSLQWI